MEGFIFMEPCLKNTRGQYYTGFCCYSPSTLEALMVVFIIARAGQKKKIPTNRQKQNSITCPRVAAVQSQESGECVLSVTFWPLVHKESSIDMFYDDYRGRRKCVLFFHWMSLNHNSIQAFSPNMICMQNNSS